jgi:hypothetical protein
MLALLDNLKGYILNHSSYSMANLESLNVFGQKFLIFKYTNLYENAL